MKWIKVRMKINEVDKVRMKINEMEVKDESEGIIIFSLNVDTYSYEI